MPDPRTCYKAQTSRGPTLNARTPSTVLKTCSAEKRALKIKKLLRRYGQRRVLFHRPYGTLARTFSNERFRTDSLATAAKQALLLDGSALRVMTGQPATVKVLAVKERSKTYGSEETGTSEKRPAALQSCRATRRRVAPGQVRRIRASLIRRRCPTSCTQSIQTVRWMDC